MTLNLQIFMEPNMFVQYTETKYFLMLDKLLIFWKLCIKYSFIFAMTSWVNYFRIF